MWKIFNNRSIGFKVLGGIFFVIAIGAGSGLFGLYSINKIGVGLETVTQDSMPMLNKMSSISEQQLKQSIIFERGLRLAMVISSIDDGFQKVSELKKAYLKRGERINNVMNSYIVSANQAADRNRGDTSAQFAQLAIKMTTIHNEYTESVKNTNKIFDLMLLGRIDDAESIIVRAQRQTLARACSVRSLV